MSVHILPRPGRHANHTAPGVVELVIALVALVALVVVEHQAVHHAALITARVVTALGSVAAVILLGVTP